MSKLSKFVDLLSEFFAHRKGLLPLIAIGCVVLNFILVQFELGWLTTSNLFLHLGIILGILGLLLARVL